MIAPRSAAVVVFACGARAFLPPVCRGRQSLRAQALSLEEIAAKWITTARNGVALKNINASYVDESFELSIPRQGGLGLELEELWTSNRFTSDGRRRGLVLISRVVPGSNAANATAATGQTLRRGDTVKRVDDLDVEGLDFDATLEALASGDGQRKTIVAQRVVERRTVDVTVLDVDGSVRARFPLPAGGNLRLALLYNGLRDPEIYDDKTMRFDAIANAGTNCGGEGTCGTCLVAVQDGMDLLIPPARVEKAALAKQKRPPRWRWSCRCNVGLDNSGGTLVVQLRPQANFQDERDKVVGI